MVKNEGQVQQYYVEGSHPYIIEPDEFDAVQAEIARRNTMERQMRCNSPFSAKIICGDCGGFYGSKVWGSNTKYRRIVWRCNDKYKNDDRCTTPHVTEDEIKEKFLIAWNNLAANRENLIADCKAAKKVLCDTTIIDTGLTELQREVEVVSELSRKAIYENARTAVNQTEWAKRNNAYLERHRKASERVYELEVAKRERIGKAKIIESFIRDIEKRPLAITEFDDKLWLAVVDTATVSRDGTMAFKFRNGTEVTA
jgi:hypothetical protein